jgi:Uma2 family endonuclease
MTMADTVVRRRFTVDDYHRMAQVGILRERECEHVELIDGEIVVMTPIGSRHNACVGSANRALVLTARDTAIVLPQGSIRLDLYNEPEPDLVLLRPRPDFYASRHGTPPDVLLVIEVSDSSIDYDRDVKGPLYAMSGIAEYWIADLKANAVWRYSSPERGVYQRVEAHHRGQSIAPLQLPACVVPVDAFLIE